MGKAYLYKGKKYSNDYWRDIEDNIYDGSLWDLLEAIAEDGKTKLEQHTYTYFTLDGEQVADENDCDEEALLNDMLEGGYLDNIELTELPTEDDQPDLNYNQTDYENESDPESPFGVE